MDLSIIILNYNTSELTIQSIESIYEHTKSLKFEIILVDNRSDKNDVKVLRDYSQKRKEIILIENQRNLGFAGGNNVGLKKAQGEFVLLLNSDTLFTSNVAKEVITWLNKNTKVGVASVTLSNTDGSPQRNGGFFPSLLRVAMWMWFIEDLPFIGSLLKTFHPLPSKNPREQDWVTGAFMLMPKNALNKVGLMSEDYFMYTEDVDFCYEFKRAGWNVWYLPQFSIIHIGGASGKWGDGLVKEFTSLQIFYKKHYPKWHIPLLKIILRSGAFVRMVLFGILKGGRARQIYAKVIREI